MTQESNSHNAWQQGQGGAQQPGASQPGASQPGAQPGVPVMPGAQQVPGQQPYYGAPCPPPYAYAQPVPPGPSYGQPGQPGAPKKRGWIVALVAVVLVFFLGVIGLRSCTQMVSSSLGDFSSASEAEFLDDDAVAIIELDGTIQYDGTACSPEGLKYLLDEAEENPHVKAIVLRVNSGGGTATAGEEMTEYLQQCSLPVVVSSAGTNASAAYEISSQADYIYVGSSTLIGSIGTIIQFTDLSGLYDMLGINVEDIASAGSKDAGSGTRPLTDEERAHYQQIVDEINEVFIQNVAEGRGMSVEEVRALATGLVFSGIDAVENGLADEIGTLEDAVAKAAELAGMDEYTTVYLQEDSYDLTSLMDLMGSADAAATSDSAAAALKELNANALR